MAFYPVVFSQVAFFCVAFYPVAFCPVAIFHGVLSGGVLSSGVLSGYHCDIYTTSLYVCSLSEQTLADIARLVSLCVDVYLITVLVLLNVVYGAGRGVAGGHGPSPATCVTAPGNQCDCFCGLCQCYQCTVRCHRYTGVAYDKVAVSTKVIQGTDCQ